MVRHAKALQQGIVLQIRFVKAVRAKMQVKRAKQQPPTTMAMVTVWQDFPAATEIVMYYAAKRHAMIAIYAVMSVMARFV
jgi:hypothetical protein